MTFAILFRVFVTEEHRKEFDDFRVGRSFDFEDLFDCSEGIRHVSDFLEVSQSTTVRREESRREDRG